MATETVTLVNIAAETVTFDGSIPPQLLNDFT